MQVRDQGLDFWSLLGCEVPYLEEFEILDLLQVSVVSEGVEHKGHSVCVCVCVCAVS